MVGPRGRGTGGGAREGESGAGRQPAERKGVSQLGEEGVREVDALWSVKLSTKPRHPRVGRGLKVLGRMGQMSVGMFRRGSIFILRVFYNSGLLGLVVMKNRCCACLQWLREGETGRCKWYLALQLLKREYRHRGLLASWQTVVDVDWSCRGSRRVAAAYATYVSGGGGSEARHRYAAYRAGRDRRWVRRKNTMGISQGLSRGCGW